MKKINIFLYTAVLLLFTSCASSKISINNSKIYETEQSAIEENGGQPLSIQKALKSELSEKSIHVSDKYCEKAPISIYQLNFDENTTYSLTIKSYPNGLTSMDLSKRTAVIPEVRLYDENFNLIENINLIGKAQAPTNTENFLFKLTTDWKIETTGKYYLVIKSDLSSDIPLTLYYTLWSPNVNGSSIYSYARTKYAKYKVLVEKK